VKFFVACGAGFLSAAVVYSILRAVAAVGHEPNPATLLYSVHLAYFWRAATSMYAGAMIGVLAWLGEKESILKMLEKCLFPAAAVIVGQAIFLP